jgi:hypothetical protein
MPVMSLSEVNTEHAKYSKQSEGLERDMRKHHQARERGEVYLTGRALIDRSGQIASHFNDLADRFSGELTGECEVACSRALASIYYDWGVHHKQEAWFHYYFVSDYPDSIQNAISMNNEAINKLEEAFEYYEDVYQSHLSKKSKPRDIVKAKKDADDTAALICEYKKQDNVLRSELKSNKRTAYDADMSEEEQDEKEEQEEQGALKPIITTLTLDTMSEGVTTGCSTLSGPLSSGYAAMKYKKLKFFSPPASGGTEEPTYSSTVASLGSSSDTN